jgi:hypothetical protein
MQNTKNIIELIRMQILFCRERERTKKEKRGRCELKEKGKLSEYDLEIEREKIDLRRVRWRGVR